MTADRAPAKADETVLSYGEERLWRGEQARPDTTTFVECPRHVPLVLRLTGPLDLAGLRASFRRTVARHGVLRSRFVERDGVPRRIVAASTGASFDVVDLARAGQHADGSRLAQLLADHTNQPFDLAAGPLIRARVYRLTRDEHVFAVVAHHIVFDGWSKHIVMADISRLYDRWAVRSRRRAAAETYHEYVRWQRERIESDEGRASLQYWLTRLAGAAPTLLRGDRQPGSGASTRSGTFRFVVDRERSTAIRALARAQGVTLGLMMAAAFKALLHSLTGTSDVVIGMPSADRNRIEFNQVVGLFLNLVVLRTDVSGNPSFLELLQRTRRTFIDAYDHADVPYGRLCDASGRSPVADAGVRIVFNFITVRNSRLTLSGLDVEDVEIDVDSPSCADFSVHIFDRGGPLEGFVLYRADQFSAAHIGAMVEGFCAVIGEVGAAPDRRVDELAHVCSPGRV
jgi:Condensation domain